MNLIRALFTQAVGIALLALSLPSTPAQAANFSPIQPGGILELGTGTWCTFNFMFEGTAGERYIGTAAHCVKSVPLGARMSAHGLGDFGNLVFVSDDTTGAGVTDYALIRVDDNMVVYTSPAMREWGGPTGIVTAPSRGEPTVLYGQGHATGNTEATRALRVGAIESTVSTPPISGWYVASNPVFVGDSGSGVEDATTGQALGIVSDVGVADKGLVEGPTMTKIVTALHAAGFDVTLMTAPFDNANAAAGMPSTIVAQCEATPLGAPDDGDSCLRPPT